MEKTSLIDITIGKIVLLTLIVLSISVFLNSCSDQKLDNIETDLIISKFPNAIWIKDSLLLYQLRGDTIFKKSSTSYWKRNSLKYVLLPNKEKKELHYLINEIIKENPEKKYVSKSDGIEYQKEMCVLKDSTRILSTIIYSDECPKKIDSVFDRISLMFNTYQSQKVQLKSSSLESIRISGLINENDTINFSSADSYLAWKGINTTKNWIELDSLQNGKLELLFSYWIDYKGNKIKKITTNDGKLFFINKDKTTYSFVLDYPISIK
jgi:hypothetical protein